VAGAALAADLDDTGVAKDGQVAGGGGPTVLEAAREVTGGELATEVAEDEDQIAAGMVRQGVEDGIGFGELGDA